MIQKRLNPELTIEGIIYTKVTHTNISREIQEKLIDQYEALVFLNEISELTGARQSYTRRIPLSEMKQSRLGEDYEKLAKELTELVELALKGD